MTPPKKRGAKRDKRCPKCGKDEWVFWSQVWRCLRCARAANRLSQRSRTAPEAMLKGAKERTATNELEPLTITEEDIKQAWPPDGLCPVRGVLLDKAFVRNSRDSATLDRIDSSKGYVQGNIAVMSHRANGLKSNGTFEEMLQLARWWVTIEAAREPNALRQLKLLQLALLLTSLLTEEGETASD